MRFEYVGGVMPEERPTIEVFERDVVPYVEKHGGFIGAAAMQGDMDAEEVIRRYNMFVNGLPHLRAANLRACVQAIKRYDVKKTH